ncbi:Uncharacterised protein [Mycobacteroides abscessus]|nr:Uncharacterised protein [Mycobacteroides abscessus]
MSGTLTGRNRSNIQFRKTSGLLQTLRQTMPF